MNSARSIECDEQALSRLARYAARCFGSSPFASVLTAPRGSGLRFERWNRHPDVPSSLRRIADNLVAFSSQITRGESGPGSEPAGKPSRSDSSHATASATAWTVDDVASHLALLAAFSQGSPVGIVRQAWQEILEVALQCYAASSVELTQTNRENITCLRCFEPTGLVVLGALLGDSYAEFFQQAKRRKLAFEELERSVLGFDHRRLVYHVWYELDLVDAGEEFLVTCRNADAADAVLKQPAYGRPAAPEVYENYASDGADPAQPIPFTPGRCLDELDELMSQWLADLNQKPSASRGSCHTNLCRSAGTSLVHDEPARAVFPDSSRGSVSPPRRGLPAISERELQVILDTAVDDCRRRRCALSLMLIESMGPFSMEPSQWWGVLGATVKTSCTALSPAAQLLLLDNRLVVVLPEAERSRLSHEARRHQTSWERLLQTHGGGDLDTRLAIAVIGASLLPRNLTGSSLLQAALECLESARAAGGGIKSRDVL
ncbi:MAG: hypothetical protein KatS3mg110_2399 [Pirellulaceae bacterium]|nr:MAG: hypothetical protein KatS3mg110_2399 [Pirellulaceae bacterium]